MKTIARFIDHTRLKPQTGPAEIERLCAEAMEFGFATVCVSSCFVPLAGAVLKGSGVRVCSVVGFPLGASLTRAKVAEAELAAEAGATELDMVMNIGYFKAGDYKKVLADIFAVVRAVPKVLMKVIIETGLLNEAEKKRAAELVIESGAGFVKTSTGFGPGGATVADVAFLAGLAQGRIGVKAAGGIRTLSQALALIDAGATRLGTSTGVAIVKEWLIQNK
ncbi:MAG: deoxyribose-phosphate aldolase [bacterium]